MDVDNFFMFMHNDTVLLGDIAVNFSVWHNFLLKYGEGNYTERSFFMDIDNCFMFMHNDAVPHCTC